MSTRLEAIVTSFASASTLGEISSWLDQLVTLGLTPTDEILEGGTASITGSPSLLDYTKSNRTGPVNCYNCHRCVQDQTTVVGLPVSTSRMLVCPECQNKRCPKASDHTLACTNSNEPGQAGSVYDSRTVLASSPPDAYEVTLADVSSWIDHLYANGATALTPVSDGEVICADLKVSRVYQSGCSSCDLANVVVETHAN